MDWNSIVIGIVVLIAFLYMSKKVYGTLKGTTGCSSCGTSKAGEKGGCSCGCGGAQKATQK